MSNPISITVQDQAAADGFARLAQRIDNMQPVLQSIGERAVERTKRRFETSTAPDGSPWKPNSAVTLGLISASLGKSYRKKNGELNAKGERRMAGKKPLIGESRHLSTQIVAMADPASFTMASTPIYAAIQHFGGKAGRNKKVTIPARPFMPVQANGELYPAEQALILADLNAYFEDFQ